MKLITKLFDDFIFTDKYYTIFILHLALMYLSYKFIDKYVINVPNSIFLIYFIFLISAILHLIAIKFNVWSVWYVIKSAFILYVFFYIYIYSFFMILSIGISKNVLWEYEYCEINDVTSSLRNKAIYYEYEGHVYREGAYGNYMSKLSNLKDYSDYRVRLKTREGLLGSKVIEGLDIVPK